MASPSDDLAAGIGPWKSGARPDFVPFPDEAVARTISDRFRQICADFADSPALRGPFGSMSYAEMASAVDSIASNIAKRVPNDTPRPIAVMMDHDGPLVCTLMAIITAGHIVVVLDPMAPTDVTSHVMTNCAPSLLIHDERFAEVAGPLGGANAVSFRELSAPTPSGKVSGGPGGFDVPERTSASPVMLAYTSGTTGESKAAVITNGVLLNLVRGATNALGIGPDDRMPMLFPVSLAVAAYPMFLPLLNGGTLATLDVRSVGVEPLAPFLETERITVAYMAPTVIRFCVDAFAGHEFPDLRMLALGGEVVDAEIVALSHRLITPTMMANGFGTTETGVITLFVFDPADDFVGIVPAGHPVDEVELLILDELGSALPVGEAGEVAVVTPHVFDGYWGYPELSTTVLSDVEGRPGLRLYRTGDLGRILPNGALSVMGRVDTKVKVRGRFVVLGDVESALCEFDDVLDAVVLSEVSGGITTLVGHVVLTAAGGGDGDAVTPVGAGSPVAAGPPLAAGDLRTRALERLDSFKVPSRFVVHSRFPSLPNGKTDRRALAALNPVADAGDGDGDHAGVADRTIAETVHATAHASPTHAPPAPVSPVTPALSPPAALPDTEAEPSTPTEQALFDLWWELLPVNPTGIDDDFAALGGDSLLAAQMLILVEHRLGVLIPMGQLLGATTIRRLAVVVDSVDAEHPDRATTVCVTRGADGGVASGGIRPRLWFIPDLQGSAYRVRHLAAALGDDQPVWSFESPFIRGEANPFRSLDTFVARLTTDLLVAQPTGPYFLAGYSFGGICAYEMARQLRADGHQVALCGVVDVGPGYRGPGWGDNAAPPRPWFGVAKPPEPTMSLREKLDYYKQMAQASPSRLVRHLSVRSGLAERIDPFRYAADLRKHGRVRPEWRLWYAWNEHWKLAATAWDRAKTYDGRMDLFWASDTPSADSTQGWGPLVADLHIHRFDGDHDSLLEPRGVAPLAAALRATLDEMV